MLLFMGGFAFEATGKNN